MDTEFFSLHLNRKEMLELQAAMVQRAMLEDEVRREKGLEPVAARPLLDRLDLLLSLTDAQAEKLGQALDAELWEHAWYAFTDEWAWYLARQEVEHELVKSSSLPDEPAFQRQVERRYTKDFEKFVREIDMKDFPPSPRNRTQPKTV